ILFLLSFHFFYVVAQNKTIRGSVTDDKNNPMPGVTVSAVGANKRTITAPDGSFSLSIPANVTQLEFSYVGYELKRVSVNNINNSVINMIPSLASVGEVVVTGYTTVKKSQY